MRDYYKQSIFWYGLLNVAKNDVELKYYITTQKELIYHLYPVVYLGVIQYSLYRGEDIEEIPSEDSVSYSEYILERYDQIYKVRYRFIKDKPKKINLKDPEIYKLCEEIITNLLLPYINEYCFRTYDQWKDMSHAYIRESSINYEYDINHKADDGKIKTSILYPFFFTLSLICVNEKNCLYKRIENCFQKEILLKKFNSGRKWKEKELDYLNETYELINNEEEWLLFLSNFSESKWNNYDIEERFKALFQLSKLTTILMKEEISTVTMFEDGDELYNHVKDYLPLMIYQDKIVDSNNQLIEKYKNLPTKILSPFSNQNINMQVLFSYIASKKERIVHYDKEQLQKTANVIYTVLAKLRMFILIHGYLPNIINGKISLNKKLYVDVLHLFKEKKRAKFDNLIEVENLLESNFMLSEDDVNDVLDSPFTNYEDFYQKKVFYNLGKIISLILGIDNSFASYMNYDLYSIFKNMMILFGPHPLDHTVQSKENIEKLYDKFVAMCLDYENSKNSKKEKYLKASHILELPSKLYNWKKDKNI